jgi:Domain of unknown function (DUF4139)/N-terminal domain of unknown function (DUF4140)
MRIFPVCFVLFGSISGFAQVKTINAETTIQNVTIFSSGARVERSATVNLQTGRSEISFAGLSNQLDQQTVQLNADANITLLSVQTTRDFLSERKIEQEEKTLIDRSASFKDKWELDAKLLEVYRNEEAMLIKNQSIGGQTGVKATELKESLDLQRQRLTEVYGKELEIQKRIISDQQDYEKTRMQLAQMSKKKDSISNIVTVLVESRETRIVNFKLLYNVKDAGWFPTYDVRVNEVTEPLSVLMNANVYQRSGETWKNISLLLSTGNPNDNATPSELQPWMLGFYDPSVSYSGQTTPGTISGRITDDENQPVFAASVTLKGTGFSASTDQNGFFKLQTNAANSLLVINAVGCVSREIRARPGYFTVVLERSVTSLNEVVVTALGVSDELQGSVAGVAVSNKRKKVEDKIQTVSVVTQFQPTTVMYRIEDKYSLETDGKTTTIGIKQFEIPALYDYYTAPKLDPSVFLSAKIPNWQEFDLQSGEVGLYFEGTYLGKTYLDLGSVEDTLSLSLGKDNGIKVARKLLKEFSTRKFIGSNRTEIKDYEINVRNNKKVAVTIRVLDEVPVSTTKEITVEDIKTPDGQVDKDSGIVTWMITLQPGQEKKLNLGYSIKYPKDRKVVLE